MGGVRQFLSLVSMVTHQKHGPSFERDDDGVTSVSLRVCSITNLKYWGQCEPITSKTLQLLNDLSLGYPSEASVCRRRLSARLLLCVLLLLCSP